MMGRRGFTMVELLITMLIFVIAIAAASNIFTGLLTQFKQQSSIAETNIQGVTGLEMMRFDVEQAGFGLPWDLNGKTYNEADGTKVYDSDVTPTTSPALYNDAGNNPPRALVVGDNVLMNGSDVLVIKGTNVATNSAAYRWTYMDNVNGTISAPKVWQPGATGTSAAGDDLSDGDCVVVTTGVSRKLASSSSFYGTFSTSGVSDSGGASLVPSINTFNLIYGIKQGCGGGSAEPPRMPFNRADYYIKRPTKMPQRCAPSKPGGIPGTGVLYKGVIVNKTTSSGGSLNDMPIVDCVADIQVVLAADTNNDGIIDTNYSGMTVSAQDIRNNLREVRVYLVVQEGQRDTTYTYRNPNDPSYPARITINDSLGNINVDLDKIVGDPDYKYYRWKVYTMVIEPYNLR